ncbi:MAG: glutamate synthase [Anaerolineales bacterium]
MAWAEQPVVKDGCGVFGVLRKAGARPLGSALAIQGIECVQFRGSDLGAGFAAFHLAAAADGLHRVKVFVSGEQSIREVREYFAAYAARGLRIQSEELPRVGAHRGLLEWTAYVTAPSAVLAEAVHDANARLADASEVRGRVYSYGRCVDVYKGVGYPRDVARAHALVDGGLSADLWLSHTRQPTNSPGTLPIWSHPFAAGECAIVHNGDISSFGANLQYLVSRGYRSHVGTDSEVIAYLLDCLTRVEGLSVREAALVLSNPYEHRLMEGDGAAGQHARELMEAHRGAQLDGPFTAVAGVVSDGDLYLLALVDRSKFRPIVVGEDTERIFVASEEAQIRAVAPDAKVWTPEAGRFVLASLREGFIERGRRLTPPPPLEATYSGPNRNGAPSVDASGLGYGEVNQRVLELAARGAREVHVHRVNGQRYLGLSLLRAGYTQGVHLVITGTPGNCLANFNAGLDYTVVGNVADDVADTMHAGRVVVHGDARDVLGQALQGGEIYVRGNVGNRCALQMREYRERRPYLLVGGRTDDYLGEYMGGGVVMVLGIDGQGAWMPTPLVGAFAGTGMVGGTIYVRGPVPARLVGLNPPREDILTYLSALVVEGVIDEATYQQLAQSEEFTRSSLARALPEAVTRQLRRFYAGKYTKPPEVQYRQLNDGELAELRPKLKAFAAYFGVGEPIIEALQAAAYTVIRAGTDPPPVGASSQPIEE